MKFELAPIWQNYHSAFYVCYFKHDATIYEIICGIFSLTFVVSKQIMIYQHGREKHTQMDKRKFKSLSCLLV